VDGAMLGRVCAPRLADADQEEEQGQGQRAACWDAHGEPAPLRNASRRQCRRQRNELFHLTGTDQAFLGSRHQRPGLELKLNAYGVVCIDGLLWMFQATSTVKPVFVTL
jgi:hypothetical protein